MKVFKFGGASVNSIDRIKNTAEIIRLYENEKLVVIISAMGKTTNALEKVAEAFFAEKKDEALQLFEGIKKQHITTAKYLLVTHFNKCLERLSSFFTEVEWLLHDKPAKGFDYYYDQIVCVGELLSTCIVSHYLNEAEIKNTWLDVRDIIRTDNNFRDATIDWKVTEEKVKSIVNHEPLTVDRQPSTVNRQPSTAVSTNSKSLLDNEVNTMDDGRWTIDQNNIFVTQGFIGSTDENESTTLGREGSDFTAAIFANLLNAESQTIWKDVVGVMNADPKAFPDAQLISELSFDEVIEMAYYGAQVIHPKTIKPLQNKGIPLHVKCFLDASLPGTIIYKKQIKDLPPIIIIKEKQAMMYLRSKDFSFVGEKPVSDLYKIFEEIKIKPNLIQTGAISLQICLDDKSDKLEQLAIAASEIFDVQVEKELSLLTIRHFTNELLEKMTAGKTVLLTQKTVETVQVLYK